jgi:hypothetical protein
MQKVLTTRIAGNHILINGHCDELDIVLNDADNGGIVELSDEKSIVYQLVRKDFYGVIPRTTQEHYMFEDVDTVNYEDALAMVQASDTQTDWELGCGKHKAQKFDNEY